MLYIGAEYCPYCAAERWSMIVALSRFGTFTGLATTRSAARNGAGTAEPYPNTATWTFANASFTSSYLTFTPVEEFTNIPDKSTGGYTTLMTPTAAQQALLEKYDAANNGAIPFIDFGNKYMSVGATYDPGVLRALPGRRSPPTCTTRRLRSPSRCSARPTTSPLPSASSPATSPRPRAPRQSGLCRRKSRPASLGIRSTQSFLSA